MCRLNVILLICILGLSWIAVDALRSDRDDTHSTKKPDVVGYGDTGDDVDAEGDEKVDDDTDDDDDEDEEALLISTILLKPYLMERAGEDQLTEGKYEGIIPDLLHAICMTGHMSCEYEIERVVDDLWGSRNQRGEWTGMIGEVTEEQVDFAAAPISITQERKTAVNFSIPFAETSLTVVVNKMDEIDSIETLLSKNITIGGIRGGYTLTTLRNQPKPPYSTMWAEIESKADSKVESIEEGRLRLAKGGYAYVCETPTARYLVERYCSLEQLEDFLPGQGYAFAFPKNNDGLENHINTAFTELKAQGKIEEIFDKWFEATCSASSVESLKVALLMTVAAMILMV